MIRHDTQSNLEPEKQYFVRCQASERLRRRETEFSYGANTVIVNFDAPFVERQSNYSEVDRGKLLLRICPLVIYNRTRMIERSRTRQ